jgi:hypothetical protein
MITKCKTISALLVLIFSNNLSAQTAEFDTTSGYLTIPLLKLGADVYEQVRFQYDGNLDFNVVDFAKKTESDAKTNATFDGSTLDLKVVKVGDAAYSNLEFAFKPPLKFSITKVQEPLPIGRTSLENRESEEWVEIITMRSYLKTEYVEKYNSFAVGADASVFLDIDLDGDDDLFVATIFWPKTGGYTLENYGKVSGEIWVNDGNGNFFLDDGTLIPDMPTFEHPRKIITTDLNGDLVPDIVIADHGFDADPFPGGRLVSMLSNIDGSHTTKYISEGFHHGISAGDFDNDGDIDLYSVADRGGGLLLNDGIGNFSSSTKITGYQNKPNFIFNTVSADVDQDGLDDIVVLGNSWVTRPTILYQVQNAFEAVNLPYREPYKKFLDAGFTDLNGDGVLDVILLSTGGDENGVNLYKGVGLTGVIMTRNRTPGEIIDIYYDETYTEQWFPFIRIEDVNDDGNDDIISIDKTRNFVLFGDGGGNFERKYADVSPEVRSWDIEFDINNDGFVDAITTESNAAPATITYGSDIEFVDRNERYLELESVPDFPKTFQFAVGDLNSDGNSDLVATATNTSTGSNVGCAVGVYFLVGKELNNYQTVYADPESQTCYEPRLSDYDSDGDLDISTWGSVRITLINDGEGGFTLLE